MAPKAKWTFMVYLAGDNNLSFAGDKDLEEMRRVGSTAQINIVTEFDNAAGRGTTRHLIQKGGNDVRQDLGETDSGSPTVLLDFIRWARLEYPADRYALVLWNHGGGWGPAEMDRIARGVGAADYSAREAPVRSASPLGRAFFRTTVERIYQLSSAEERAICSDDGSGHSLDTIELGHVLAQTVDILGQKLDLLGMDACLMNTLEVAYQARPYVEYLVGSEENEPGDGWDYEAVLRKLTAKPAISPAELATHIVKSYIQFYIATGSTDAITQSALDLSRLDSITGPLDDFAGALIERLPDVKMKVIQAIWQATSFHDDTLYDISHFSEEIAKLTRRSPIPRAARAVRSALRRGSQRAIIAESHRGRKVERCAGLTIYIPNKSGLSRYYGDLEYARSHRWLNFLETLVPA